MRIARIQYRLDDALQRLSRIPLADYDRWMKAHRTAQRLEKGLKKARILAARARIAG